MKEFIEKLIGRLEECEKAPNVESPYNYGWKSACQVMKKAVNELADEHNNGFCEWKAEDEEGFSNCRFTYQEIISDEVKGFAYCPYCGKKIKVVE